jgi:hypothetical protein
MHRYRIRYRDTDPGCPTFSLTLKAYDAQDAEERFFDSNDTDWIVLSVKRLRESLAPCFSGYDAR